MILTGRAAKHAEEFELVDEEMIKRGFVFPEIGEDEQIDLFDITMMFERDLQFRNYMRGILVLYIHCVPDRDKLSKLFMLMKGVTVCL